MSADAAEEKWAKRLERERAARRQVERLAEQGMRELWLANQTLEEKVAERTAALDRSLLALEQASRLRQRLLAELGHELATPLHALIGNLELVDARVLSPVDRGRLLVARTGATRLDGLLQALLTLADLDPGESASQLERRQLVDVVDEIVDRWQRRAARRGQLLVGELSSPDAEVNADWPRLVAAADAILDACVQFAGPGAVHVELGVAGDLVSLVIEDSGPPLDDDVAVPAPASPLTWAALGRRGIGLAIVQRMADESDATLGVRRSDLGGLRAQLGIPVAGWSG